MTILSPVTQAHSTKKIADIDINIIVEKYKELGIEILPYFKDIDHIEIRECEATGYRFYYPYFIFGDDLFYEQLQLLFSEYYVEKRWEHVMALDLLSGYKNILEVGSGSGYFLMELQKRNYNAVGLELSPKAIEKGIKRGVKDIRNELLDEHSVSNTEQYDAVCSFQVLEHIYDVNSYFESALKVLKPKGKIIIAVPNNNPFMFKHDIYHTLNLPPHHAGLWNKAAFERIPSYFPLELKGIYIEPLTEYKDWFKIQVDHAKEKNTLLGKTMSLVPRLIYKTFLHLLRKKIEGRNIIAVFEKK